jgi:SAM-dependent methyltransferase
MLDGGRRRLLYPLVLRLALRFREPWLCGYVWGKLHGDPVFAAAFELLKDGPLPVLDIGCGVGLLEFYLRERGFAAPLTGIDFDAGKIRRARRVAARAYPDVVFLEGDGLAAGAFCGHVVIFDVLHYLEREAQTRLLEHAAACVAPGGYCIVRDTPRGANWRFRVTQCEESWARSTRWLKTGVRHYPSIEAITAPFEERGFLVTVRPLWGRTPFNSHLFVFRAPDADGL